MKIVLDTNVLVSGIFFTGPPADILKGWRNGNFILVTSKEILLEYHRVAEELSRRYPGIDITRILELITIYSEVVEPGNLQMAVSEDPDDDKFIACALAGNCEIIVSGDKHLLKVSGFRNIRIITPRKFYDTYLIQR